MERYEEVRADYLTQRFIIQVPDRNDVYALNFKMSGRHALRVYVNGSLAGQMGKLGTTKEDTVIWENNLTCYAAPQDGKMEILLHSAQFYHFKRGASLATLSLHPAVPGFDSGLSSQAKGYLVMGVLLFAAIFLLCLFLLQPGGRATLYFALACLAMVLREYIQSEAWTDFSFIKELGAKRVIIIGGPEAVKVEVEEKLKMSGFVVERIYGQSRYDTAYEIARRIVGGPLLLTETLPNKRILMPCQCHPGKDIMVSPSSMQTAVRMFYQRGQLRH